MRSPRISVLACLVLTLSGCVPDDWHYAPSRDATAGDIATRDAADDITVEDIRDVTGEVTADVTDAKIPGSCEAPRDVACASGLVDLYRGDGNARDCVGAQHAVAHRAVTYVAGRSGSAFNIDGAPAYVSIPSAVGDFGSEFTITLWIKSLHPGRLLARRAACFNAAGYRGFDMGIGTDGTLNVEVFSFGTTEPLVMTSPTRVMDDAWHHVALLRRSARVAMYVDGQTSGPRPFTADFTDPYSTPVYLGVSRCVMGAPGNNGTFDDRLWFRGALDEVGFYNRALTDEEVADLAAGRCAP